MALGIQHLTLALIQTTYLFKEPHLYVLISKNALRPEDHHCLNTVETDDLYDNIIHSAIESVLCAYMAKEHNKALRREFGAQETNKNLLLREVLEVEGSG